METMIHLKEIQNGFVVEHYNIGKWMDSTGEEPPRVAHYCKTADETAKHLFIFMCKMFNLDE